jgi:hypothetical protein
MPLGLRARLPRVTAITAGSAAAAGSAGGAGASPASLDAQLNTCRAQLEDWVTCPSSKTPEGKAKVEALTARFAALERQIEQAGKAGGAHAARGPAVRDASADTSAASAATGPANARGGAAGRGAVGLLGGSLDVYA